MVKKEMDLLNKDYLNAAFPADKKNYDPQKAIIGFQ